MKTKGIAQRTQGFTILELLIAVAIVAVLAVIAIPAYQKYKFDAYEAEGVRILLEAYRDEMRVKAETGSYTEYLDGAPAGQANLYYRASPNTRFNLITGKLDPTGSPGGKYSFSELGYNVPPKLNSFGAITDTNNNVRSFMIGIEADLKGDGTLHVLSVNEKGELFKLCDQWSKVRNNVTYSGASGRTLKCAISEASGGGNGFVE